MARREENPLGYAHSRCARCTYPRCCPFPRSVALCRGGRALPVAPSRRAAAPSVAPREREAVTLRAVSRNENLVSIETAKERRALGRLGNMNPVIRLAPRMIAIGLVAVGGCASAPAQRAATPAASTLETSSEVGRASHLEQDAPSAPLERHTAQRVPLRSPGDSDADCVFLENAARAIEQYRAFIEHAGSSAEYAAALAHSRDQITDLQAEMEFVHSGMAARGCAVQRCRDRTRRLALTRFVSPKAPGPTRQQSRSNLDSQSAAGAR